jgi:hypothetical protein
MPPPDYRLSVSQYHRMIEVGILTEEHPVELLEGWLVQKPERHPRHENTVHRLKQVFDRLLGSEWLVRVKSGITMAESEPEPDLAVVRGPNERFKDRHPGPTDVVLVVEVTDSTLTHDRTVKARIYARARLAEFWIVNLKDNVIEAYRDPTGPADDPAYGPPEAFGRGRSIPILGVSVAVDEIL